MPDWLKTMVLIVGLGGWLATVVVSLIQGELPNAATLGIPTTLLVAFLRVRSTTIARRRARPGDNDGTDDS